MSTSYPQLLGAHLSIAGGLENSIKRATQVGATCVQIFTKNNKAYFAKALTNEQINGFKQAKSEAGVSAVTTHAAYLINIGASNLDVESKSRASLVEEIVRCHQLEIPYLVLHPGSHTGAGVEAGIAKIAKNLHEVIATARDKSASKGVIYRETQVLLETAAGQGTNIGSTFEEIKAIYDAVDDVSKPYVAVCLDTCHIFAAGYDISTSESYDAMWEQFDQVIGFDLLKIIHLNDSKMPCNARRDRHANLGKGEIPLEIFKRIATDERLSGLQIILETPSEDGITEYQEELQLLRSYQQKP